MTNEYIRERWNDPINISKYQWIDLLQDRDITREEDIKLVKLIYSCEDFKAIASQLKVFLNMEHHAPINSQVGRWGKRIVTKLGIQAPRREYEESYRWWNVPFLGEGTKQGFYWTLRQELREALPIQLTRLWL
jgi:5-methylcytosine-specific restriction protein A